MKKEWRGSKKLSKTLEGLSSMFGGLLRLLISLCPSFVFKVGCKLAAACQPFGMRDLDTPKLECC